ncbi:MAG: DUF6377 domain-containing protein [Pseudoflavonifractor sp.]|nr:DUF6377 domain-containing protein [Pseudoflavonifractor sp.]
MLFRTLQTALLLFTALSLTAMTVKESHVSSALQRLDNELSRRQTYIDKRQVTLDSLKNLEAHSAVGTPDWYRLMMELGDGYTSFKTDSAITYYNKGLSESMRHGDSVQINRFKLQLAVQLPLVGRIGDALDTYDEVVTSSAADNMKEQLYDSGRQMYSYISSFFSSSPDVSDKWQKSSEDSQLKLLGVLNANSPKYKLNKGEYYFSRGELSKARAILEELLENIPESSNIYARACHMLSDIAWARDEKNAFLYYLTLSAIADTKSATLEVMSLQELGKQMYERGETARAHEYLSIALDNAVKCNAMARMVQSSEALPIIESAHALDIKKRDRVVKVFIAIMVLLVILLGAGMLLLRKEMRNMKVLQGRLEGANHVKEVYISQFLSLCSIYMDKLNQFCKIANRKISAGKVEELHKMTKSGKFIEEQSEEFYEVFDNAFLHIYPNFVEEVNKLLRPEDRIVLQEGERLNTDLRILAFMRLGIEESPRIAQMLNYSVNTIYTYRNKLKNRAIDRDNFEKQIMNISSIS